MVEVYCMGTDSSVLFSIPGDVLQIVLLMSDRFGQCIDREGQSAF